MEPKPDFLYHYTSIQTLFKLIDGITHNPEDKEEQEEAESDDLSYYTLTLWGSHILYMNDPTENLFYYKCLQKALKRYEAENDLPPKAYLLDSIKSSEEMYGALFVVSLCSDSDSLSMWRMYGADGCGAAIGFNYHKLESAVESRRLSVLSDDTVKISKVRYGSEEDVIGYFTDDKLQFIYDNIRTDKPSKPYFGVFDEEFTPIFADKRVVNEIQPPSTLVKPKPYSDEKEWRLYCKESTDNFRERNGLIIPYYEFKIPLSAVGEIIIGPCAEQELLSQSLTAMLKKKLGWWNFRRIEVKASDIPFVNK